jgi:hypothetical protein
MEICLACLSAFNMRRKHIQYHGRRPAEGSVYEMEGLIMDAGRRSLTHAL